MGGSFLSSFGPSAGSFLSGLGDKFGNFMNGTTPELAIHPGASIPGSAASNPLPMQGSGGTGLETQGVPAMGRMDQAPSFSPTGHTTGGLLSKLQDPDSRGLTFGDKLFAAGSVLQGDSGGAATYLQNQRSNAQNDTDRMTAKRAQLAGARAFSDNIDPETGELNIGGYAKAMGPDFDPEKGLALRKALEHNYQLASLANGGAGSFDPRSGRVTQQIAGERKAPDGYSYLPNGQLSPIDPNYVAGQKQIYGDRYTEQRLNRTFAPRAPAKPAAPRPTPTGRSF